jgi:flagellar biosynthesis activator protein FlaF
MQSAAQAYGATAKKIANPRELEADLLLKAASRLQAVKESWKGSSPELDNALLYNRKLWTIFMSSVAEEGNPLPVEIRQNIANLGLFVVNQTISVIANPAPERLTALININRELAAGLLGRGGA